MSRIEGLGQVVHGQDTILILGSIASVESLAKGYHYAHPSNRFWKVLARIYQQPIETLEDKKKILADHSIALWDSCRSCQRIGSADASIKAIEPNDIPTFLKEYPTIERILCNGQVSYQTMKKTYPELKCIPCPSTSAANARWSLDALVKEYGKWLKNE
ncbi:DNA-deoxyinosine glycosylase [Absicoccus intestinalis]|uniref:DNA-deoxyinosine glycosylase n=1 Tax=Absicoccus intestinalis TaxID=2926319 RepID=A0ABU4WJV1_9FIRM|nr:DNA-deoxyinosine glycosylase [Absicoccus sp. CLA-KB-P134]MDX8416529.1 DNA-deoxyinosine glycosylase [Absicoccus sp. CLA-KB-P134]